VAELEQRVESLLYRDVPRIAGDSLDDGWDLVLFMPDLAEVLDGGIPDPGEDRRTRQAARRVEARPDQGARGPITNFGQGRRMAADQGSGVTWEPSRAGMTVARGRREQLGMRGFVDRPGSMLPALPSPLPLLGNSSKREGRVVGTLPLLAANNPPAVSPIYTVFAALLSGTAAALITYLLARRKLHLETDKLQLDMVKTGEEIEKLERENAQGREQVQERLSKIEDKISDVNEEVLYHSTPRESALGHDLDGRGGQMWTPGENAQPVGPSGEGEMSFLKGAVINIDRFNTEGRFEVSLRWYQQDGGEHQVIPKRPSTPGQRHFTVALDAKVSGKPHTLRLTLRQATVKQLPESESAKTVASSTWTSLKFYLSANPSVDCWLRMDDQDVMEAPSSIQLRDVKLVEAVSPSS
jgi:hypothetical protein